MSDEGSGRRPQHNVFAQAPGNDRRDGAAHRSDDDGVKPSAPDAQTSVDDARGGGVRGVRDGPAAGARPPFPVRRATRSSLAKASPVRLDSHPVLIAASGYGGKRMMIDDFA